MKKLNLYNFLAGFLTINVINLLAIGGIRIGSYEYRLFSVALSVIVFIIFFFSHLGLLKKIWRSLTFKLYLVFAVMYLLRLFIDRFFYGIKLPESSGAGLEMMISVSYILIIPMSLISIVTIDNKKFLNYFFYIFSGLFFINAMYSPTVFGVIEQRMSTLENIGTQTLGIFSSILFVWSILKFFEPSKKSFKILLIPVAIVSFFYLAISATRSVFAGSLLIIILFMFLNRKNLLTKNIVTVILFAILLLSTMPIWESWFNLTYIRFQYGFETGSTGRQNIWPVAIEMFLDSPVFGNYHVIPNKAYFHNYFLDALVSTGILGGLLFTFLNFRALKICFKWLKLTSDNANRFYSIMFLLVFTFGMFSSNLYSTPFYWGILIIVISLSEIEKNKINNYEINNQR